jgi:hypothetical protein
LSKMYIVLNIIITFHSWSIIRTERKRQSGETKGRDRVERWRGRDRAVETDC